MTKGDVVTILLVVIACAADLVLLGMIAALELPYHP
jgi:hypothetical protein